MKPSPVSSLLPSFRRNVAKPVFLLSAMVSLTSLTAHANTTVANSSYGSSNAVNSTVQGRLSGSDNGSLVPAQATMQEAITAASLPSQPIINAVGNYQNLTNSSNNSEPTVFGEQLFRGAFASTSGSTFNDSYVINAGDNVQVRMWGAYQYAATMTVDPQGNIFLPNVGPVRISGITNAQLQAQVEGAIRRVYRTNVGVYASLEQAQPVKVFVTGFVNQPGYYGGLAADSVLSYLDRAGGVDPNRGSFIDIDVIRAGKLVQQVNLYNFLLGGLLEPLSFRDGDIIRVKQQRQTFTIEGNVDNPYTFEFSQEGLTIGDALSLASPDADATNISITRSSGRKKTSEYYSINEAIDVPLNNGDQVVVTSDRYAGTMAITVQGAHQGNGVVILPYGARLQDVVAQLQPSSLASMEHLTIYRKSVAEQQREMINKSLDRLEEMTLASQSTTKEEAELRSQDAELVKQFIAKARNVQPSGQIVVVEDSWKDIILQQGDMIEIPEMTSVITVNGNVRAQGALTYNGSYTVGDYIAKSGGFDDNADNEEILIIHQNGEHEVVALSHNIQQGDEIMVLPKIKTKKVEITRGISQIIYQLAVATRVILSL